MAETDHVYVEACANPDGTDCVWRELPSGIPELSIADASVLLGATITLWAVAWVIGILFKSMFWKTR